MKKYLRIFWLFVRTGLIKDLSFRFSFFTSILGSFIYVVLHFFTVFVLFNKIKLPGWGKYELLLLFGIFLILIYSTFFIFWRGLIRMIRNIRDGKFDYYLILPVDSQFIVSIMGGGVHNFIAILAGIFCVGWALLHLSISFLFLKIILALFFLILALLDFYSFGLFLLCLNFKYGYLEEILFVVFSLEDFMQFPLDIYKALPSYILFFILPISLLTSLPSSILLNPQLPLVTMMSFTLISCLFIYSIRRFYFHSLRSYSSGS